MPTNCNFNEEAYRQYKDEVIDSQGFHVLSDYGSQLLGGISRVGKDSEPFQRAVVAARFAVEEHNEKANAKLKFLQVLNVNVEPTAGSIYYVTLEAIDEPSNHVKHYHAKVWSTINHRFQVQIFRVAPYAAKDPGVTSNEGCCIRIDNLQPWMDENYLYYKCFYRARDLHSIKVNRKKTQAYNALLQFKSRTAAEEVLADCAGKLMPSANQVYKLVKLRS